MKNPLISDIREILEGASMALSEYQLMQALRDSSVFSVVGWEGDLALFQRHFFLMNALYQLQAEVEQEGRCRLDISALAIKLVAVDGCATIASTIPLASDASTTDHGATEVSADDIGNQKVRDYYLDWANYRDTDADDVSDLLNQFWKKYWRVSDKDEAFEVLGLAAEVSELEIKKRYQSLASEHHPDKGGDAETFIKIRQAYETLIIN